MGRVQWLYPKPRLAGQNSIKYVTGKPVVNGAHPTLIAGPREVPGTTKLIDDSELMIRARSTEQHSN